MNVKIWRGLAGVLALSEILLSHLSKEDLPTFADLFERALIADWNLCDWFCVKVLGNMLGNSDAALELVAHARETLYASMLFGMPVAKTISRAMFGA